MFIGLGIIELQLLHLNERRSSKIQWWTIEIYIYLILTVRNCNQPFHTCKTTKSERAREVLCTLFYMQLLRHSQGQTVGKINKFFIYIQVLFFLCCARLEQSYIKFCCQASQVSVRLQKRNMYAF